VRFQERIELDHVAKAGGRHRRGDPDRGRVVNDLPPKDRDIAMVFQNYALYPHMTVEENLAFDPDSGQAIARQAATPPEAVA